MCDCNKTSNAIIVMPTAKQLASGAIGLSKLALSKAGILDDNTNSDVIMTRLDICRNCEFATRNKDRLNRPSKGLTSFSQCSKCACVILLKVQLKSSTCPLSKWNI